MPGTPAGEQLLALACGVGDAEVELGLLVAVERLHGLGQRVGYDRLAELAEAHESGHLGDRHDSGDDRNVDSRLARRRERVPVDLVVEEELRDQEPRAVVHLGLQEGDVGLEARCLRMDLGKTSSADPEVEVARDQRGELRRTGQSALGRHELLLTARRVAAQREDVLDPAFAEPL